MKIKVNFPCSGSFYEHPFRIDLVVIRGICGRQIQEFHADKAWFYESAKNKDSFWRMFTRWCDGIYHVEYMAWPEEEIEDAEPPPSEPVIERGRE